ncbi:hypothetical protein BS47DRAFT_1347305 [Hydnum rufescens UP504]|uniref:DUF6533 domain-containing protein n=1 Tax=Hydnum rufescens UP504 TaxID=1448309 RepID=A0A9P6DTV4_9AGAM|nr:hypothetical protein BS47DRAFT_1347305 [Hydnum rufescens UP504]
MSSIQQLLPPSLALGPHLSAARYFLVCSLTVAAWDTLVLSPRTWRLQRTPGWPLLKVIYLLLRYIMPIEFIAIGVTYLDPNFSESSCRRFYLFEPIMTAVLMMLSSSALVIRASAIYEQSLRVKIPLSALLLVQFAVHFASCFFYRIVPLKPTQGCIPGPQHDWVGVYWAPPTLLYIITFVLALNRSIISLRTRHISWWKLTIRDGLTLYAVVMGINLINLLYFFLIKAQDEADPVKTIVTSMTTVLTVTMTMRIILNVRGSLYSGGTFDLSATSRGTTSQSNPGSSPQRQRQSSHLDVKSKQSGNGIGPSSDYVVKDTDAAASEMFESPVTSEITQHSSPEARLSPLQRPHLEEDLESYDPYLYDSHPFATSLPASYGESHHSTITRAGVRPLPRPVPMVSMDPAARRRKEVWDAEAS